MKDMTGRMRCIVPGCGRTYKDEGNDEIICGKHWRLADVRWRRLMMRVRRKAKRVGWTGSLLALDHRLWVRCRDQAIERAMGI